MKNIARLFFLVIVCLLTGKAGIAQDYVYATGNPPFSVNYPIENGFINIANGNLHMEFSLATHKQRGALKLNERLVYDSRIWMIGHYSNYYWWPNNIPNTPNTQDGWRFIKGNETGSIAWNNVSSEVISDGCPYPPYDGQHTRITMTPVWTDPSGTAHSFTATQVTDQDDCAGTYTQTMNSGYATDATGYSVKDDGSGNPLVIDNDGTEVYPQVIDRFGNYWSTDANGNLVDDTGRTPVIVTQNGNVTYYDVLAPNGSINNNGTRIRYTVTTGAIQVKTFFYQVLDGGGTVREWPDGGGYGTLYPVKSIQLPDGTSYTFTYDEKVLAGDTTAHYGDLSSVTLATGGIIHYGFEVFEDSYYNQNRWASGRKVGSDSPTTFTHSVTSWCSSGGIGCREQTIVHKPSGDETSYQQVINNGAWNTNTDIYSGAVGGTSLASIINTYCFSNSSSCPGGGGAIYITKSSETTTLASSLSSQKQYVYNSPWLGKLNALKEWNFFQANAQNVPPSSTPNRETDYTYNGLDLSQVTVLDNGVQTAQTTYDYTTSATTTTGVLQHGTTNAGGPYLQKVTQWLNGGTSPYTTYVMDDTGMVTSVTDPKQNPANTISYQCANSLPYQTSNSLSQTTTYGYDCNSGAITSVQDPNDAAASRSGTTYQYEATAGRLHSISYPDGGQTTYSYPSSTEVDTTVAASPDPDISSQEIVDSFGRPSQHIQAGISTETSYDSNGRVYCTTNPHSTTSSSSTDGSTCITVYDGLDRPKTQTQSDGTSSISWSYSGNTITFTDEAGNSWQRTSDAFGRLTQVIEPGNLNTTYQYDARGNLTCIDQWGTNTPGTPCTSPLKRSFIYDSLSRQTSATMPESGTITYAFSDNGNMCSGDPSLLCRKTDARGSATAYTYDALNRLTDKTFLDGQTPGQHFRYDQTSVWMGPQSNTIGRLSQVRTDPDMRYFGSGSAPACNPQNSATANYNPANGNPTYCNWTDELYSYDAMGRVTRIGTAFPSEAGWAAHGTSMGYDLAGNLTSLTYPDGRVVTQGRDAAGRLQNVVFDNWNGQHIGYTYASGFTYTPTGAQTEVTYGNGVYNHTPYNNRQQICQVWVQNSQQPLLDKHYFYDAAHSVYCAGSANNNGNITQIADMRNGDRTQTFTYDSLNRLASFSTVGANQTYNIDSFGNLSQSGTLNSQLTFDSNNRINSGGYTYDAAGNINGINNGVTTSSYFFDAESRIVNVNSGGGYYTYDAASNRMRKDSNDTYTEYQYLNGQPIAERRPDGNWTDYIYANGQKIAMSNSFDVHIRTHGTFDASGEAAVWTLPFSGYVVKSGDRICWRQLSSVSGGGLGVDFTNGSSTAWTAHDQDGNLTNSDTAPWGWHNRCVDLSPNNGLTVAGIWIGANDLAPASTWDIWFGDISINSTDGTVTPLYWRDASVGLSSPWTNHSGPTNLQAYVETTNPASDMLQPDTTTTYYHGDQVGSTLLMTAAGGWPIYSGSFYPFGQEPALTSAVNHYKFAGLERDDESKLDHATFRQYSSTMGRWMAPDPYLGSINLFDPQSLNRYSYVGNSPLTGVDPSGLLSRTDGVSLGISGISCAYGNLYSCAGGALNLLKDIIGLFGHPHCSACDHPRPDGSPNGSIWDEHGGFHPHPYSSIAAMIGDVSGLYSLGCEFGACGGGFGFQQSGSYPNVGVNCRGIETYHLGLIFAQHCDATVSIGDGWLYSLSAGPIDGRLRGFVTKTHTLPTGDTNFWKGRDGLGLAKCLIGAASASQASSDAPQYHPVYGPNSNIWLNGIFSSCGVNLGIKTHGPYF